MMRLRKTGLAVAAVAAASLPLLSPATAAPPRAAAFAPPASPVVLVRELRRPLPGGKEIVARRRYAVTFAAEHSGYRVDGRQIDVAVDAPPSLAALAQLEREREDGVFPLHLDAQGLILDGDGDDAPAPQAFAVERAARIAGGRIAAADLPTADRRASIAYVQAIASPARATLTAWPRDLFRPQPGERQETTRIALPDGAEGTVTTVLEATAGQALFDSVRRTVVTELSGTSRTTIETWRIETPRMPR